MTATIKTLKTVDNEFAMSVEGKSQAEVAREIDAAGYTLSKKNIAALMKGEVKEAMGWKALTTKLKADEDGAGESTDSNTSAHAQAAAMIAAAGPIVSSKPAPAPKGTKAPKQLTPEQEKIAADAEAAHPALTPMGNKSYRGTDWTKVLPQTPQPVKPNSKQHLLFVSLCDPKGKSKQELMDEFGWSEGGLAGIIHWEPKAKGFKLLSEKVEGVTRYRLGIIATGKPAKVSDIELKAAPEPKAPKAPKAPKTPAEPKTPKVRVNKEQMASVPPMAGAAVTKRVSAKKAAAQAKG